MHTHGALQGPVMWTSLTITLLFVVFEAICGAYAKSLALLSDAGHNFSDAFALGLAAYAVWIARRPANASNTFGYHRVAILTALINASTLVLIAVGILIEAVGRLRHPVAVNSSLMLIVSVVAVLMNTVVAALLQRHSHHDMNMRAAYVHMAGDALSAISVIIAALIYHYTRWTQIDPIVSALIGVFIFWSSWSIVRDATSILLEGSPKGMDLEALVETIRAVDHVGGVHDIHVWTVSDGMNFMSCHVVVDSDLTVTQVDSVVQEINSELLAHFGIAHATIQTEPPGACVGTSTEDPLYCDEHVPSNHAAERVGHDH